MERRLSVEELEDILLRRYEIQEILDSVGGRSPTLKRVQDKVNKKMEELIVKRRQK